MTKKRDTSRQRLLASARKALASRHADEPLQRFNARVAKIDVAGKRLRRAENQPTPEQEAKAVFVETDVNEHIGGTRIKLGRAFRRQARFESIEGVTLPQLLALRRYRRAFDTSELSPVKSALDIGPGGGGGSAEVAITRMEAIAFADIGLRRIEATVPPNLLPTLRAIALRDMDFKAAAAALYGTGSSRRRAKVSADFLAAAQILSGPSPEPAVSAKRNLAEPTPKANLVLRAAFVDDHGYMRPMKEIADLIRRGAEEGGSEAA